MKRLIFLQSNVYSMSQIDCLLIEFYVDDETHIWQTDDDDDDVSINVKSVMEIFVILCVSRLGVVRIRVKYKMNVRVFVEIGLQLIFS